MAETRPLIVRCDNRMTFEVDRISLEARHCSRYDAYCFSDPESGVEYLSLHEWLLKRDEKRRLYGS